MPDRPLYAIRSGKGGFWVVASTARQALVHVSELTDRGLDDVHVTDSDGRRQEIADLEAIAASATLPAPGTT